MGERAPAREAVRAAGARLAGVRARLEEGRILVTGGTGFFGGWLLATLFEAAPEAQVDVLTRDAAGFRARRPWVAEQVRVIEGDVRRFEGAGPYRYIVHAATEASAKLSAERPLEMWSVIVEGTRRVLEMAGEAEVLLASSGAVYGRQPEDLTHVDEEYAGAPETLTARSCYGEGKRAAEQLCALYGAERGVRAKVARCFAFSGEGLPLGAHFAFGNFLRDALAGGPIRVAGDGTARRSYLDGGDLAVWLWRILVEGEALRAYNVGSEREVSIAELAEMMKALVGGGPVEIAGAAGGRVERYVPSTRRARTELGLAEWTGLEETIVRMARWQREGA